MAASIRIIRQGASGGLFRSVEVHIDGSKVGTIAHGSEGVFSVASGRHVLSVCLDVFFGSPDVAMDVADGQTYRYVCREAGLTEGGFLWFLRPKHYLVLEPVA